MTIQKVNKKRDLDVVSIVSRGARVQFGVAIALTTILPLLTLAYLFFGSDSVKNLPDVAVWAIGFILAVMVCLGYGLLIKYPLTIINLRRYMESVARGEIPAAVDLPDGEGDIIAIQEYFNMIIAQMKKRIEIIREQQIALLHAERQRVMIESLCTACHHLGQPATSISCYLDLLKREPLSAVGNNNLALCIKEADRLRATLHSLQRINNYNTEPYCEVSEVQEGDSLNIIKVRDDGADRSYEESDGVNDSFRVEASAMATS